jgi:GntR family transcriptional regulator of abcA and norABC
MESGNKNISQYKLIAKAIEKYIADNALPAGARLPATRKLADQFNTSHYTVYIALEELKSRGILESKPQAGFYVSAEGWEMLFPSTPDWNRYADRGLIKNLSKTNYLIAADLEKCYIGGHFGAKEMLDKAIKRAVLKLDASISNPYNFQGTPRLREAVCEHMRRYGVAAHPDEVLILYSPRQASALLYYAFMRMGTGFIREDYLVPKNDVLHESIGVHDIQVRTGRYGIDLEHLKQVLHKNRNVILFTVFGSPNLYVDDGFNGLSDESYKKELMTICLAHKTPIVEIDIYRDILPEGSPKPAKAFDKNNQILYLGSLAVSHNFGISWIHGPKQIISRLTNIHAVNSGEHNFFIQAVTEELLEGGLYRTYLEELPDKLNRHTLRLREILNKHFGDIASVNMNSPAFIFLSFIDKVDIVGMYGDRGDLSFSPGYLFHHKYKQAIVMSSISMPAEQFESTMAELRRLADKHTR